MGFSPRALARILELVFGQALGLAGGIVAAVVLVVLEAKGSASPGWAERFEMPFVLSWLAGFVAHLAGATVSVRLAGVSIGKLLLRMRVVTVEGGRPGWRAAFVREVGFFVDSLFFGLIGMSAMDRNPLHQRHGDGWAGTVVVRSDAVSPAIAANGGLVALALVVAFATEVVVLATAFVLYAR